MLNFLTYLMDEHEPLFVVLMALALVAFLAVMVILAIVSPIVFVGIIVMSLGLWIYDAYAKYKKIK